MKKRNKILLIISLSTALMLSAFSLGVYAAENWMNFEGEEQAKGIEDDMDAIMKILKDVHKGKKTAEEAKEDLEKEISKKDEKIADLEKESDDQEENRDHIEHLEDELKKANKAVEGLKKESGKHLEKAQKYKDDD